MWDCIKLFGDMAQWFAVMFTIMKLMLPYKSSHLLTS